MIVIRTVVNLSKVWIWIFKLSYKLFDSNLKYATEISFSNDWLPFLVIATQRKVENSYPKHCILLADIPPKKIVNERCLEAGEITGAATISWKVEDLR